MALTFDHGDGFVPFLQDENPGVPADDGGTTTPKSKLAELRAKLIARRNAGSITPVNGTSPRRSEGPPTTSKPDVMELTAAPVVSEADASLDINALLAEGRAAADAKSRPKKSIHQRKEGTQNQHVTSNPVLSNQSTVPNQQRPPASAKSDGRQQESSIASADTGEVCEGVVETSPTIVNAVKESETRTGLHSMPAARDAVPQKCNSPAPQAMSAMDGQIPDHLYEWLEMTGWFDENYRERALNRHRRRKKLSYELAKLAQEDEADRGFLTQARSASVAETYKSSTRPTTVDDQLRTLTDAPSPLLEKDAARGRKRSLSTSQRHQESQGPVQKSARNDHADRPRHASDSRVKEGEDHPGYRVKGAVGEPIAQRPRTSHVESGMNGGPNPPPKELFERRPSDRTDRRIERRPINYEGQDSYDGQHDVVPASRWNERSRNANSRQTQDYNPSPPNVTRFSRNLLKSDLQSSHTETNTESDAVSLELHKGGVRYFMIKSWNHDNVSMAQHDNTWATQEKNSSLLEEAFNHSRHVILFFSVNKSVAFQGYARMESPPVWKKNKSRKMQQAERKGLKEYLTMDDIENATEPQRTELIRE
ncbi:MAG: hypothetical protein Q9165_002176 [Trypethelium subeluteriae]